LSRGEAPGGMVIYSMPIIRPAASPLQNDSIYLDIEYRLEKCLTVSLYPRFAFFPYHRLTGYRFLLTLFLEIRFGRHPFIDIAQDARDQGVADDRHPGDIGQGMT
jgi:hypothetical protein